MSEHDYLQILQHALGVDRYGRGTSDRNHFVTGPGSADFEACTHLVDANLMYRRDPTPISGGDYVFMVSMLGRSFVSTKSPPPPKLTRSQKRYQQYLDCSTGQSFKEWIKGGYA